MMNVSRPEVRMTRFARLIDGAIVTDPFGVTMSFASTNPYAVLFSFAFNGENVKWEFGRELLDQGIAHIGAGEGDVQIHPGVRGHENVVRIILHSPDGHAEVEFTRTDMLSFLSATYQIVARGEESRYMNIDDELALLMSAEPQ